MTQAPLRSAIILPLPNLLQVAEFASIPEASSPNSGEFGYF